MTDIAIVPDPDTTTIIKHGETCLQGVLYRNMVGTAFRVKVHPGVEEFFAKLAGPDRQIIEVKAAGRFWSPVGDKPLTAYYLSEALPSDQDPSYRFSLTHLGGPLITGTEEGREAVNLSWLRLVGISDGITFGIKGVHTLPQLRSIQDRLAQAFQSFYRQYMRPINLGITVSTTELPQV